MATYEVVFEPDGVKARVAAGVTIMDAANSVGIILDAVCGGAGTCNKCLVEVDGMGRKVRACQTKVDCDMVVTIPEGSRFFEQKILQEGIAADSKLDPLICKHHVILSPPELADLRSDAQRLIDAVDVDAKDRHQCCRCHDHAGTASGSTTLATGLLKSLPALFRAHNFAITATCCSGRIFALEPGDTTSTLFGAAVDVGTTTVVLQLADLNSGAVVARASAANPQVAFGDDVISRIDYTRENADGLGVLQRRIIDCVNKLVAEVCEKSLVKPWQIYEMTIAGNATMQHLFLGIPVEQIAQAPYVGVFSSGVNVPADTLGLNIHPQGNVYVMPSVAAHVGGDTVAVALATAMKHSDKINLAVDIGTNGELVLGNKDRLLACSTAAGPAFEGARIQHGMRGASGAIERVHINDDVVIGVIGGGKPSGICGSGLIDAIAELIKSQVIDVTGRLLEPNDLPSSVPAAVKDRVIVGEDGKTAFVLARAAETQQGHDIILTQRDIREAQLGKAAIQAGIVTLMNEFGVQLEDIDRLYLAGAFGNYIRAESACAIGLLPEKMPLDRIQFVGNAAGAGAKEVLLNRQARMHAEELGAQIEYVELAGRADFQNVFSECMMFGEF
ncbi:MAG: DUF4445 domain-containing protein [Sedimentisphaerales bacterium]|nr:DUF4445 domain-containing protein [Sedimentisphaerales bacterium]